MLFRQRMEHGAPLNGGGARMQTSDKKTPSVHHPENGFQPLSLSTVQPEKVIARPDRYVGASLWSGPNGTYADFDRYWRWLGPDVVWIKIRSGWMLQELIVYLIVLEECLEAYWFVLRH